MPDTPAETMPSSLPNGRPGRRWLWPALVFCYVALFFTANRLTCAGLSERDGYFHVRYAQMLPSRGLVREFPWIQCSTWKDDFRDKEFLFHVLLVPFTRDAQEPANGAVYFSVLLILAIFGAMYLALRAGKVPWPALWLILLMCLSGQFLERLEMIRPHLMSLLLCFLGMAFLVKSNWRALVILGFLFSWSYCFPFALALHACLYCLGHRLAGGDWQWKLPVAATGGALLGSVCHPYGSGVLEHAVAALEVMRHAAGSKAKLAEGAEMYATSPLSLLKANALYPFVVVLVLGTAIKMRRLVTPACAGFVCLAGFWLLMSLCFSRFVEYGVPFAVLAAGMTVRDVCRNEALEAWFAKRRRLAVAGVAVVLLAGHLLASRYFFQSVKTDPPRFRGAARWLAQKTEPGETVVNLWWHDFPDLYYDGYRQHYVWGIDPNYTLRYSPEKAMLLEDMRSGRRALDGPLLAKTFNARYLVLQNWSSELDSPAFRSGAWKPVYFDDHAVIFDLNQAPSP